jgi:hypothetical protein
MISKKKWMGFVFILIPIISWIFISSVNVEYVIPEYEKISDRITAITAQSLRRKYQLDPIGSGGSMMHDVEMLALSFNCYRPLSIDESRKLIISCANEYLRSINDNEEIRPYLHNYPFTEQNIQVTIFVYEDSNFTKINPGQVSSLSTLNGKIRYKTRSAEDQYKRETLHQETYEEAVCIVKEQGRLAP